MKSIKEKLEIEYLKSFTYTEINEKMNMLNDQINQLKDQLQLLQSRVVGRSKQFYCYELQDEGMNICEKQCVICRSKVRHEQ